MIHKNVEKEDQQKQKPLSHDARILLAVGGLFTISTALSGTFVNVYLWRARNDFVMIGIFNLFQYLTIPAAFFLGGQLTRKKSAGLSLRIGLLFHIAFFLSILLVNRRAPTYVIPLGILLGLAAGFYWVASQILTFDLTNRMNRDTFNSTLGMIFSISGMLSPLISGYVITVFPAFTGYRLIFLVSVAFYVVIWLVSYLLKTKPYAKPIALLSCYRKAALSYRYILLGHYFFGIRNGIFMFLINLLVFITAGNELSIGKLSLVTALVSFVTFYGLEKILKPKRRVFFFTLGAVMMLCSVLFLVWRVNLITLFTFGILNAIFVPFFHVPFESATLNVIDKNAATRSRTEYIILKEIFLNLGRLTGVVAFILILAKNNSPIALRFFLLVVGTVQLLLILFLQHLDFDTKVASDEG